MGVQRVNQFQWGLRNPLMFIKRVIPIESMSGWSFAVNRVASLMPRVIQGLDLILINKSPESDFREVRKNSIFTYVDTYNNTYPEEIGREKRVIALAYRLLTNDFSDKGKLGEEVKRLNLSGKFSPRTFLSLKEAKYELNPLTDPICFVKGRHGTGGGQVQCVKTSDLERISLPAHSVIQESVQNLWLYNQRKVVIRFYMLTHMNATWFGRGAFAVIHGEPYDPYSTDFSVQIKHSGYMQEESKIRLLPLQSLSEVGPKWERAIEELSKGISPLFQNLSLSCGRDVYALFGIDAIPTEEGKLQMIEINNYPNMLHTAAVNDHVNIPCIASLMALTLTGVNDGFWTPLNTAVRG
jgi:hypothetical protein